MIKIAGHLLWQPRDMSGSGNKLPAQAGEEAGVGQRLDSIYSTSGCSSQDSDMIRHCKRDKSDKDLMEVKTKRKVGRPIAYQGDPDSPDLDPEERQIILRRIANRRSARRGRERRQNEVDKLTKKVLETEASNAALKARVKASESKENAMRHELTELRERARELAVKNGLMQHDIAHLTSALAERRQARQLEPGHTTIRGSPAPPLPSATPIPTPPSGFNFLTMPQTPFPPGNALDLPQPISPLPALPSPFPDSPVPQIPEHYMRELLQVINWSN
ncbi:g8514 [Coccomyxa viridis]|uniref:G8514 protein n=1 Tax=Coccomyxa viridis TaxID=1274662 RepID=A0ABP1G1L7_9CHLO